MWHEKVFIFMIVSFNFHLVSIYTYKAMYDMTTLCLALELFSRVIVSFWHKKSCNMVSFIQKCVFLFYTRHDSISLVFAKALLIKIERMFIQTCIRRDWPETKVESSNFLHRFWTKHGLCCLFTLTLAYIHLQTHVYVHVYERKWSKKQTNTNLYRTYI